MTTKKRWRLRVKLSYVKYRVTPEEFYYCVLREEELPLQPIPSATPQTAAEPRPDFRRRQPHLLRTPESPSNLRKV